MFSAEATEAATNLHEIENVIEAEKHIWVCASAEI